jgi:hypothetical protein
MRGLPVRARHADGCHPRSRQVGFRVANLPILTIVSPDSPSQAGLVMRYCQRC